VDNNPEIGEQASKKIPPKIKLNARLVIEYSLSSRQNKR